MIAPILKRQAEFEQKLNAIQNFVATKFNQACENMSKTNNADALKPVKVDMPEMRDNIDKLREAIATGKGAMGQTQLSADDFKQMLPAKIDATPLSEIVKFSEGAK